MTRRTPFHGNNLGHQKNPVWRAARNGWRIAALREEYRLLLNHGKTVPDATNKKGPAESIDGAEEEAIECKICTGLRDQKILMEWLGAGPMCRFMLSSDVME